MSILEACELAPIRLKGILIFALQISPFHGVVQFSENIKSIEKEMSFNKLAKKGDPGKQLPG